MRSVINTLGLSNVVVIEAELEKFAHSLIANKSAKQSLLVPQAGFNLITFRAFRSFESDIVKGLFRLCSSKGIIAAYKGRLEKIEADIAMLEKYAASSKKNSGASNDDSKFQYAGCEIIPCPTPLLAEVRHVLLIRGQKPA